MAEYKNRSHFVEVDKIDNLIDSVCFSLKIIQVHMFCSNFSRFHMFCDDDRSKIVPDSTRSGVFPS